MYLTVVPKKFKREKERDFNLVVNTIYNQGVDKLMTNYQEYSHNYLPTWTRHIENIRVCNIFYPVTLIEGPCSQRMRSTFTPETNKDWLITRRI